MVAKLIERGISDVTQLKRNSGAISLFIWNVSLLDSNISVDSGN